MEFHGNVYGQVPHQEDGTILGLCQQGLSSLFAHSLPALEIIILNKVSILLLKIFSSCNRVVDQFTFSKT